MKILFSIHAGEYLVGQHIEDNHKSLRVWVPSKDTGVDLMLSNANATRTASIQVKFSKDYTSASSMEPFQQEGSLSKTFGWFKISRKALQESPAQWWILVLLGFNASPNFVIIRPRDLLQRLDTLFGPRDTFQSYVWLTKPGGRWKADKCWEVRDLNQEDRLRIVAGTYENASRDLSSYLVWDPILKELNG
jgi:hypothetical protein